MNLYLYDQDNQEIVAVFPLKKTVSYDRLDDLICHFKKRNVLTSNILVIAKEYEQVDLGEGNYLIKFQY